MADHFDDARRMFEEYGTLYRDAVMAGKPGEYSEEDLEKYKLYRGLQALAEGLASVERQLGRIEKALIR